MWACWVTLIELGIKSHGSRDWSCDKVPIQFDLNLSQWLETRLLFCNDFYILKDLTDLLYTLRLEYLYVSNGFTSEEFRYLTLRKLSKFASLICYLN